MTKSEGGGNAFVYLVQQNTRDLGHFLPESCCGRWYPCMHAPLLSVFYTFITVVLNFASLLVGGNFTEFFRFSLYTPV